MKAYLAYYSDYVIGSGGVPIGGATVSCYSASAFAVGTLPTGGSPVPTPVASVTTDQTGLFIFPGVPPDDYHLLITYSPPGGTPVESVAILRADCRSGCHQACAGVASCGVSAAHAFAALSRRQRDDLMSGR